MLQRLEQIARVFTTVDRVEVISCDWNVNHLYFSVIKKEWTKIGDRQSIPKWATNYPDLSFWIWVVLLVKTCHGKSYSHMNMRMAAV